MCSINGIFRFNNSSKLDLNLIRKMNYLTAHRGPDSSNIIIKKNFALGANRLAIVDAENIKANQPFIKHNIHVIFNGEIYNYKSLRKNLIQKKNIYFESNSDTEVILELYKVYGIDFIKLVEGMFSICIYDETKKIVYLIRDRIGEKPFFYYHNKDQLIFSSELKSIVSSFPNLFSFDMSALEHYFSLNYILTNKCIFSGINKLEAGCYIEFNFNNYFKINQYWKLEDYFSSNRKFNNEEFEEIINEKIHITSEYDKQIGTFLSGGLDSSYIASIVSKSNINNISTTYKFNNKLFDESYYAEYVAKYLNIENLSISDSHNSLNDDLRKIVYALDEPMSDTSIIPFYQLCKFSKKYSKVFISGDGGDEIFLGYDTYIADKLNIKFNYLKPLLGLFKYFFPISSEQDKKISNYFKYSRFIENMGKNFIESHYKWRKIFDTNELKKVLSTDCYNIINDKDSYHQFKKIFNKIDSSDILNKFSFVDIKTWLVNDILVKSDRLSMSHGLEVRSPFLNHKLVEYIASLSSSEKIGYVNKKKILKKLCYNKLPKKIINRSKKGFNSPVASLLNNELKIMTDDYFNSKNIKILFNKTFTDDLLKKHRDNYQDNHLKIFNILILLLYLDIYNIRV